MLLPYLECKDIYDQLDLRKPWNHPQNVIPKSLGITVYKCFFARDKQPTFTNYVAITGPDTLWPDDRPGDLRHIPDGAAQTILAIEIGQSDIAWGEPRDFTLKEMEERLNANDPELMFSPHECRENGYFSDKVPAVNVLFADGHVAFCPKGVLRKYLQAMLTPDGGERIDVKEEDGILVDQAEGARPSPAEILSRVYSPIFFIASSLLLIFMPMKKWPQPTTPDHDDQAGDNDPLSQ
jgi:prepilin-type processing-associated H-X9-DG protein